MRAWKDNQTWNGTPVVDSTTSKCWGSLTDESATPASANSRGNIYATAADWTWPASTAATAILYLSISDVAFEPAVTGSQGRLVFKPVSAWHALYSGQSVFKYDFGSNVALPADSVC